MNDQGRTSININAVKYRIMDHIQLISTRANLINVQYHNALVEVRRNLVFIAIFVSFIPKQIFVLEKMADYPNVQNVE